MNLEKETKLELIEISTFKQLNLPSFCCGVTALRVNRLPTLFVFLLFFVRFILFCSIFANP